MIPNEKYIIVKEVGCDLFSLKHPYGISKGPINTPVLIPVEKIKKLVNQYNMPEVYEVAVESTEVAPNGSIILKFTEPVLLTAQNVEKPYSEIAPKVEKKEEKKVETKKEEKVEEPKVEKIKEEGKIEKVVEEAIEEPKEDKKKGKK